ncbi:MAG: hypothetical protein KKB22_06560, partial [Candidatus Omnitrophica bacterium]|nr:hypothetical protein [Candidatus Omnitrophota bacterium]
MKKILNKKHRFGGISTKASHILIALITCLILVAVVEWDSSLFKTEFREGDIVLKSIYAPFDFKIKGDIDYKATEAVKKEAMALVPPVYLIDSSAKEAILSKVSLFSDSIKTLKEDTNTEDRLSKIKETIAPYDIPLAIVNSILDLKDPQGFFAEAIKMIEYITDMGVITASDLASLNKDLVKTVTLIDKSKNTEQAKFTEELVSFSDIRKKTDSILASLKDRKEKNILVDFISSVLSPNLIYQEDETNFRKQAAAAKVKPIYTMVDIKKNELILTKGERISKSNLAKLEAIEKREPYPIKVVAVFGIVLIIALFMLLLVFYIEFYEPNLIVGNKELMLLASIVILMTLAAKLIVMSPWPSNLIPV